MKTDDSSAVSLGLLPKTGLFFAWILGMAHGQPLIMGGLTFILPPGVAVVIFGIAFSVGTAWILIWMNITGAGA